MTFREIVATLDVTFTCFVLPIFDVIDHRSCYVYTWPTKFGSLDLLLESRSTADYILSHHVLHLVFFQTQTQSSKVLIYNCLSL